MEIPKIEKSASPSGTTSTAWILYDAHKIGSLNQCLALCEKMGFTPILHPITLGGLYKWTAPFFRFGILRHVKRKGLLKDATEDELENTFEKTSFPPIVIASGRQAAGVAASLSKFTKVIFILNPYISLKHFYKVIIPRHDGITGDNVETVLGSVTYFTQDKLEKARKDFPLPSNLPPPYITVLLGGDSAHFTYTTTHIEDLCTKIRTLYQNIGGVGSILITSSRRTRPDVVDLVEQYLQDIPHFLWRGEEAKDEEINGNETGCTGESAPLKNPYLAFLSHARTIIVTGDSISMISEACAISKIKGEAKENCPVLIYDLGIHSKKFHHFLNDVMESGEAAFL